MRHGCYKLCPRVREQLRKAREAEETSDDSESESSGRNEGVAGSSGVRRERSKDGSSFSSAEASRKPNQVKKGTPGLSHESLKSRNRDRKKQERNREKEKTRKPEVEKRRDRGAPTVSRTQRKGKSHDCRKNARAKRSFDRHDMCDRSCRGIDEMVGRMENEKRQETFDEYIINKGLCYFEDLCNCHYACLIDQLWRDPFVTSTIASAALFAIGLKLCSELDGWRVMF